MAIKATVRHRLTKKEMTLEISDNFKDANEVEAHLKQVIPDHDIVKIEIPGIAIADDPSHPRLDPSAPREPYVEGQSDAKIAE